MGGRGCTATRLALGADVATALVEDFAALAKRLAELEAEKSPSPPPDDQPKKEPMTEWTGYSFVYRDWGSNV